MRLFELFHNSVVVLLHSEKNSLFSHKRAISRQCCIDFVAVSVSAVFSLPFLTLVLMGNCCHSVSKKKQLLFLTKLLLNSLKESSWWLISRNTQKRSWFLNYKLLFEVQHKHKAIHKKFCLQAQNNWTWWKLPNQLATIFAA